jgi:hypothetical protein
LHQHLCRQGEIGDHAVEHGAAGHAHVDAAERALSRGQRLQRRHVHHRKRRARRIHRASHAQCGAALAQAQHQRCRLAQCLTGRGVEEHGVGREQVEPVAATRAAIVEHRHQRGGHARHHQRIHAQQLQRHGLSRGVARQPGEFKHGAGHGHLRMGRHALEQHIVQRALARTQFRVGLAVDGGHRLPELGQRRCVDELHRERQRHAQRDGQHRHHAAPRVVAQLLPGECGEQPAHGGELTRPARRSWGVWPLWLNTGFAFFC